MPLWLLCVRWTLIYTLEQTCLTTNNQTQTQTQTTKPPHNNNQTQTQTQTTKPQNKKKQYKGRSMYEAHKSMKLTDREFNAVATHLVTTLRELGVKEDGAVAVLHALSFLCLCVDL
jgi:TFIIF-interacting CTD phosphatase-like protein